MVSKYLKNGYIYSQDITEADVILLNTCSFIGDAIKESIEVMDELEEYAKSGKEVIVFGCLLERYPREIKKEFPLFKFMRCVNVKDLPGKVPVSFSEGAYEYLKICEGCLSQCSYCAIPKIRGPLSSRTIHSIIDEAKRIEDMGKKEIILIGQDTTAYGFDLKGKFMIQTLLEKLVKNVSIPWIRLMYAHPAFITDELIEIIAREKQIVNYIDLPIQHSNSFILNKMNRGYDRDRLEYLLRKLNNLKISVRTTVMVGFPYETDKRFEDLISFLKEHEFSRIGAFIYSKEEGTGSYNWRSAPKKTAKQRYDKVMRFAKSNSLKRNKALIGSDIEVIIDGTLYGQDDVYVGRSQSDCPEIDGLVYVHSPEQLDTGDIIRARVSSCNAYDLIAESI